MNRFAAIGILVGVTAVLAAVPAAGEGGAGALVREGYELIAEQRFARAVKKLEKALESGGAESCDAHLGLAAARSALGEPDRAMEHARRATELAASDEQRAHAYHQLGRAAYHRVLVDIGEEVRSRKRTDPGAVTPRDWSVAEDAFRRAVELGPDVVPVARVGLAQVLGHERRYDEALAELETFESRHPGPAPELVQRAIDDLRCQAEASRRAPLGRLFEAGPGHPDLVEPKGLSSAPSGYTEEARRNRTQGTVVFEAVIDSEGRIACVQVLTGLPHGLTAAAEASVRQWLFEPATLDGEPVSLIWWLTVSYALTTEVTVGR